MLACRGCGLMHIGLLLTVVWLGVSGCAKTAPEVIPSSPTQQALIGKTKKDLMACATGQPEQSTAGDMTLLRFYKEASILEESFAASKGSVARVRHGCWATLGLRNDRVEGVQYDSVPTPSNHEDHCDEIFASCVGSVPDTPITSPPKLQSQ